MASKKEKQSKLDQEKEEIKPGTSEGEEYEFIAENIVKGPDKKKPEKKKDLPEQYESEEKKHAKEIKEVEELEQQIKKDIEIRKIVKPTGPTKVIKKTSDLLGQGFHYFVDMEQKITHDFFFGWLPSKIKKYIKLFIPFILMAIILQLHIDVDPQIKKALALFVCISMLWALESISMIVTALLIPVLAVALGIFATGNPFAGFSNPIIYLLLSGLIIAQAFRKNELDKLIALKVLSLSKGKVKKLLLYLMIVTAAFSMWMSNTATIALLIPVILSISSEVDYNSEKNHSVMFLLSAGFASAIGSLATILGSNPNAITAAFLRNVTEFDFLNWSVVGFPIFLVLFVVVYILILKIYKVENEIIDINTIKEEAGKIKLNHNQRKLLIIFLPTIFLWLFGGEISHLFNIPDGFYRTEIIGLAAAILLFSFRVLEWDDVRRIPWEIFLLVGGGLTLGQILIDTGSATLLAGKLFSTIQYLPTLLIIFIIVVLTMVLTNFVNNSSATIILVPVLMEISPLLDMNQVLLIMTTALATAIAPLTPIAMPAFSLIYGTGKIKRRDMVTTGIKIASVCAPVLALLIYGMNVLF